VASPILGYASTINDGLWWSLVLFKWCLGKVFYCWVESRDLFRFISMFFSRIFKSSSFFGRKFGFPKSRDELGSSYSVTNILSDVPTEWNMPCDLSPATPGTLVMIHELSISLLNDPPIKMLLYYWKYEKNTIMYVYGKITFLRMSFVNPILSFLSHTDSNLTVYSLSTRYSDGLLQRSVMKKIVRKTSFGTNDSEVDSMQDWNKK